MARASHRDFEIGARQRVPLSSGRRSAGSALQEIDAASKHLAVNGDVATSAPHAGRGQGLVIDSESASQPANRE
jgi:hypothetical protein